jgi:hypothetical protein
LLQPADALAQSLERRRDRRGELTSRPVRGLGQRGQLVLDEAPRPGKLTKGGLNENLRHLAEHRPGRGQRLRHAGQPARSRQQPLGQRREIAGE